MLAAARLITGRSHYGARHRRDAIVNVLVLMAVDPTNMLRIHFAAVPHLVENE